MLAAVRTVASRPRARIRALAPPVCAACLTAAWPRPLSPLLAAHPRRGLATQEHLVPLHFRHGAYGIPKRVPLNSPLPAPARPERRSGGALGSVLGWFHPPAPPPERDPDRIDAPRADQNESASGTASAPFVSASSAPDLASDETSAAPSPTPEPVPVPPIPRDHVAPYALPACSPGARIRDKEGNLLPDHLRSVQVGEDAFFLRPDAMGVADGVGGWTSRPGANAALFSRLLMHFTSVELSRTSGATSTPSWPPSHPPSSCDAVPITEAAADTWALCDPVETLRLAWRRSVRVFMEEGLLGSSTALVAVLQKQEVRIANLGDCVLLLIRDGDILFRSTEQQHSFNFPLQLGMMGDTAEAARTRVREKAKMTSIAARLRRNAQAAADQGNKDKEVTLLAQADALDPSQHDPLAHEDLNAPLPLHQSGIDHARFTEDDLAPLPTNPEWDEPRRDAGRWAIAVAPGDIVILGSDGLMDNLFDEDILEEVLRFGPAEDMGASFSAGVLEHFSPQSVAEALCRRAKFAAESPRTITSPFQERAMEEGLNYVGGKNDDISVIVSVIQPNAATTLDVTARTGPTEASDDPLQSWPRVTPAP